MSAEAKLTLRQQAEQRFREVVTMAPEQLATMKVDSIQKLFHELSVHQIELELQNEELRRAQVELDALHARYFALYDLAPVGNLTVSDKGLILEVNLTASKLLGAPKSQLVTRPFSQFIAPANQDHYYLGYRLLVTTGQPLMLDDLQIVKADGTRFWGQLSGNATTNANGAVEIHFVVSDCSERKKAMQQVVQAKETWERTFDAVPDLISIIDPNHKILRTNRAMAAKLGVTPDQAIGMKCFECVHGLDQVPDFCPHAKLMADQQPHASEVYEERLGSHFLVTCTPVHDQTGELLGSVHVARNITERKRQEAAVQLSNAELTVALEELKRMQDRLVQTEKQRMFGQMASGLAHDFNNALAPIVGFSDLLLTCPEKLDDQATARKFLQLINTSATDAVKIVRQMGFFARQPGKIGKAELIDLNKLVQQSIALTEPHWKDLPQAAGKTIKVVADLMPIPGVIGEAFAFREVLINLIFNSVAALNHGGVITVRTLVEGETVGLWVHDTGPALPAEVQARLFEPFFTTKKAGQGLGLGLSMVKHVVEQYNGTVSAESCAAGTTFKIRLPIVPATAKPEAAPVASTPAVLSQNLRVLVVDDEPMLLDVAEAFLSDAGQTVVVVSNGAAALAQLQTGKFDVVLTDKGMPEMNGDQLAAAIKQHWPKLPVVMMTGFGSLLAANIKLPPNICALVSKPFTKQELLAGLAQAVPAKTP